MVVDWLLDSDPAIRWQVMDEGEGKPSRWNTLRAMRVLDWYEDGPVR
jgi:hypothetical protein